MTKAIFIYTSYIIIIAMFLAMCYFSWIYYKDLSEKDAEGLDKIFLTTQLVKFSKDAEMDKLYISALEEKIKRLEKKKGG